MGRYLHTEGYERPVLRLTSACTEGRTRDELVATQVLGQPLIIVGQPEASPLVQALRGAASGPIRAYFGQARAEAGDLAVIEQWIRDGCPEVAAKRGAARSRFTGTEAAGDDQHTAYMWVWTRPR